MGFRGGPIDLQAVPELRAGLNRMWGSALAHMAPADESQPKAVISEERRVPGPEGAPEISLHIHLPTRPPAGHLLVCPMLDDRGVTPSSLEFSEANASGWSAILGSRAGTDDAGTVAYSSVNRGSRSGWADDSP